MWNIIVNINITTRNTGTYFLLLFKRMGLLFFFFFFISIVLVDGSTDSARE